MIPRIRLFTTALFVCQLLLRPGVVTIQAHAAEPQQESATPAVTQPASQAPAGKSPITARRDNGEEDTKTEQIIQQELNSSDQEQGPPRPATNVPLGRNEVLIRADEQEKQQDIYHVRGHVEIRFGEYILHCDQATYDSTTGQVTATGHVVFDGGPRN